MRVLRNSGAIAAAAIMLNACGGGCDDCVVNTSGHSITANINGLVGSRLTLSNNGVTATIDPGASGQVSDVFSGLQAGAAYNVTVVTQPISPNQTCVIAGGSGTVNAATVAITISCTTTPARFLIAQNGLGSSQYCLTTAVINPDTGVLTAASAPPLCGSQPSGQGGILSPPLGPMTVDTQGKFLYLDVAEEFHTYGIDPDSGAVSLIRWQSDFSGGEDATYPAGGYDIGLSFGGHGGGGVSASKIDPTTGALTVVSSVTFDNTSSAFGMTVDPLGRFVYAQAFVIPLGDSLTPLTFDANSGTLARNAAAIAYGGGWVVAEPHGKFLFAAAPQATPPTIGVFSVSASNGALSAVSGATVTSTESSADATVDPSGHYLFTPNYNQGTVTVYAIDGTTGRLAAINGSPFSTGPHPMHVLVEPQGHFLYVSGDSGISAFQIDSGNGSLTAIAGSPFAFAPLGGRIVFSY